MFSACFSDFKASGHENTNSDPLFEKHKHKTPNKSWKEHFGTARLKLLQNVDLPDLVLCPLSLRNSHHRPRALQMAESAKNHGSHVSKQTDTSSAIQVLPLSHRLEHHTLLYLTPSSHSHESFEMRIMHQNHAMYLGTDGFSVRPQLVKVWSWDFIMKHPNSKHCKCILITDVNESNLLQMEPKDDENPDIMFDSKVPSNLYNMVFIAAPIEEFISFYHNIK